MRIRHLLLALSVVLLDCVSLDPIPPNTCGNGVIDAASEDCDSFPSSCGKPNDAARACRLVCNATTTCPAGWGCATTGICRQATGVFASAGSPVSAGASTLVTGDFDGDGRMDIVGTPAFGSSASGRAHFFDADGNLETTTPLQVASRLPVIRDFDRDGRADLGFVISGLGIGAFGALSGRRDRTFATLLYPALTLPSTDARPVSINASSRLTLPGGQSSAVVVLATTGQGHRLRSFLGDALLSEESLDTPFPLGVDRIIGHPSTGLVVDPAGDATCGELVVAYNEGTVGKVMVASPCEFRVGTLRWANRRADANGTVPTTTLDVPGIVAEPGPFVGDIDGDGLDDVLVQTLDGRVFRIRGGPRATLAVTLTAYPDLPIAVGDLDADGRADLVYPTGIELTAGADAGATMLGARPRDGQRWAEARIARFNGDEIPDVLVRYADGLDVEILGNNGDGRFTSFVVRSDQPVRSIMSGDFDGDRIQDVAFLQSARPFDDPTGSGEVELVEAYGKASGGAEVPRVAGRFASARTLFALRNTESALDDLAIFESAPAIPLPTALVTVIFGSGERQAVAPLFLRDEAALSPFNQLSGPRGRFRFWRPGALAAGALRTPDTTDLFAIATGITISRSEGNPGSLLPFPTGAWLAPENGSVPGRLGDFTEVAELGRAIQGIEEAKVVELGVVEVKIVTATGDIDAPPDRVDEIVSIARTPAQTTSLYVVRATDAASGLASPIALPGIEVTGGDPMALADVNADGLPDVVAIMSGPGGRRLFVLLNNGASSFFPMPIVLALPDTAAGEPPVAFVAIPTGTRADGKLATELAIVTTARLFVASLKPDQSGFDLRDLTGVLGTSTGRMTSITAGDFDGDGVVDLAVSDSGAIRVIRQLPRLQ